MLQKYLMPPSEMIESNTPELKQPRKQEPLTTDLENLYFDSVSTKASAPTRVKRSR